MKLEPNNVTKNSNQWFKWAYSLAMIAMWPYINLRLYRFNNFTTASEYMLRFTTAIQLCALFGFYIFYFTFCFFLFRFFFLIFVGSWIYLHSNHLNTTLYTCIFVIPIWIFFWANIWNSLRNCSRSKIVARLSLFLSHYLCLALSFFLIRRIISISF